MSHVGAVRSSDPRAAAQAAAIGARIGGDGWWYDAQTGRRMSHPEVDQLVNAKGIGQAGAEDFGQPSHGWFGDTIKRNSSWLKPLATIGASFIPGVGPIAAGALNAGWTYADTHDLGKSALNGAATYLGGRLAGGAKPGAGAIAGQTGANGLPLAAGSGSQVIPGAGKMGIFDDVVDAGKKIFKKPDGSWDWEKIGKTTGGAYDAYNKNRTTSSEVDYRNAITKLQRDQQELSNQEFAAKYGFEKADAQTRIDEFNREQGTKEGLDANALQRQADLQPLRDRAIALVGARMAQPSTPYQARDITKGDAQYYGGATGGPAVDMANTQAAAARYTPGAGGTNNDLANQLIARFRNPTPIGPFNPGSYDPTKRAYTPPNPAPGGAPPTFPGSTTSPAPAPGVAPTAPAPDAPPDPEAALEDWKRKYGGMITGVGGR